MEKTIEITDAGLEADIQAMEELALKLGWASHRRMELQLSRFGLTISQYTAMRCIAKGTPTVRMSDLADAAHQVMPTMTGIIDRLVYHGLVERRRDPADRRSQFVALTESGRRLLGEITDHKHAEMAAFLRTLSEEERRLLITLLARYLEEINASIETTTSRSA